ncbi:hypothetical protein JOM56_008933 [Amanita muscaria]
MDERTLYIKGYKLDCQKIRSQFPKQDYDPEDNYELCYYTPIIDSIPETAYKYVGCGVEPNGHDLNLVLVLEDGYDQTALMDNAFTVPDTLPNAALSVLTPGIWPSLP